MLLEIPSVINKLASMRKIVANYLWDIVVSILSISFSARHCHSTFLDPCLFRRWFFKATSGTLVRRRGRCFIFFGIQKQTLVDMIFYLFQRINVAAYRARRWFIILIIHGHEMKWHLTTLEELAGSRQIIGVWCLLEIINGTAFPSREKRTNLRSRLYQQQ